MNLSKQLILSFGIAATIMSCDNNDNNIYEKYIEVPDYKWSTKNTLKFEVNITDTLTPHNIYVIIRNSTKYEKNNLWLFINTIPPKGEKVRDTLECVLADNTGRWLGDGFANIFYSQFLLKQKIIFPQTGKYIFEYEQAMRKKVISGITDVGLRIEKHIEDPESQ